MASQSLDVTGPLHARIEALFRAHVDAVYNVAYRVLWNAADAEDVVQAAFVKAFTRLDQLEDDAKARPALADLLSRSHHDRATAERRSDRPDRDARDLSLIHI